MINLRQYRILSFFLTRSLFLGGCFSLLVNISKNSMIISGIIGMLLGYFLLYLVYKCKGKLCKFIKVIICLVILLISTLSSTMLTSNYLLSKTPTLLILLFFYGMLLYGKSKNLDVIGRISEIIIIISLLIYVLGYIGILKSINISNMLPIMNSSFINVIKGIIIFIGASLLPNILLINECNEYKFKDISIGYILGSLSIIVIMFFILTIYGSELSSIARFPEYLILKKINIMDIVTNLENVLVMEWIVNIVICCLFSIKVMYESMNKYLFYVIILMLIVVLEYGIFKDYGIVLMIKNYIYYICFGLCILSLLFRNKKTTD